MLIFSRQPHGGTRLGDFLQRNLRSEQWTSFRAGVAFAKQSGVRHIKQDLAEFASRGHGVKIAVGVDLGGTSAEGLSDLLDAVAPGGEVWVFHNEASATFHPKVYVFSNDRAAEVYVGSGNLTEGGLFTNYEAGLQASLNLQSPTDRETYEEILGTLDSWSSVGGGTGQLLTRASLATLLALGYVHPEQQASPGEDEAEAKTSPIGGKAGRQRLFSAISVPAAPAVPKLSERKPVPARRAPVPAPGAPGTLGQPIGFVMTLQQTDVGVGQVSEGTSRRSPEIFIPLAARDAAPDFWDYPARFREDPRRRGKWDRTGVRMRIGGQVITVNMMTWPDKHDFRLRSEALRSAGNVGDILRLEKTGGGTDFDYYAEVIPRGTSQYNRFAAICATAVRNSKKMFGYY